MERRRKEKIPRIVEITKDYKDKFNMAERYNKQMLIDIKNKKVAAIEKEEILKKYAIKNDHRMLQIFKTSKRIHLII